MSALSTARSLAAGQPEAMLPCPLCAASLRAENLERHLTKTHPGSPAAAADSSWRGLDGRVHRTFFPITIAVGLGAAGIHAFTGAGWLVFPIAVALLLGLVALAGLGKLRARLSLDDRGARLTHTFGLLGSRIALPAKIEIGSLYQSREQYVSNTTLEIHGEMTNVPAGSYVRLGEGRSGIIVGCRTSTDLRAHWAGWEQGERRRGPDVLLDPVSFVALQYALARRGALALRGAPRS